MRNKNKSKPHHTTHPPFFLDSTSLPNSLPRPPEAAQGDGILRLPWVHYTLSLLLLRAREGTPHTLPQPKHGGLHTGDSSPQISPAWVLPVSCSSSWTATLWVLPAGCSSSGTDCSSVGPLHGHKSCQQTCSGMGSSLHGSTGPGRSLLQHGLPTGSQPHLGASTSSSVESSRGCMWTSAPPLTSMSCKGTAYLTTVFSTSCRGISDPAPGVPPPPPSLLTLVSAELCLLHILTPLSQLLLASWHCLCLTRGQLLATSYRSHPCSLPTTKTLPCKPSARYLLTFHLSEIWLGLS